MTVEKDEDSLALARIRSQNDSEEDCWSKQFIITTQTYDEIGDQSNRDDTSSACRREANATSSLRVVYFSMVITDAAIAICLSSTWPFMQKIDQNVSPKFLGWVNCAFYAGASLSDVIFGRWMHYRPNREPLICSLVLMITSSLISVFAQEMGQTNGLWAIMVSRILLGMTRGSITVARSIITETRANEKRSRAFANLTMSMTLGFTLGSALQAAIAQLGEKAAYIEELRLNINLYTIPAFIAILLALLNCSLIMRYLRPSTNSTVDVKKKYMDEEDTLKGKLLAFVNLMAIFVVLNFGKALVETLTTPFIQHQFALTRALAVWYSGLIQMSTGIIAFMQQGILKLLLKRYSDRVLVLVCYSMVCINFFLYVSWGNTYPKLTDSVKWNSTTDTTKQRETNLGCPSQYDWCKNTPQIWLPQMLVAVVLFAIGFSSCNGLILSLYTKVLGFKKQGTSVGIISASGNIARIAAPLVGSASYVDIGPRLHQI
eukprot:Seg1595.3 transcript_id=Seg1595.3/GoldUCD/mRNA.D3Y31 product="Major facilitator superfamily domain-containing protein 8" protein_id=Seg1595.3/GoldUCD/D3Y31